MQADFSHHDFSSPVAEILLLDAKTAETPTSMAVAKPSAQAAL